DLFRRGLAPRAGDTALANLYQDFARGYFSLYISGPWNIGEFARRLPADLADRWTTAPLPAPGDGYPGVSLAGGASLAVSRGSDRKDAAWKLVEFLSQPAQQGRFYRLAGASTQPGGSSGRRCSRSARSSSCRWRPPCS